VPAKEHLILFTRYPEAGKTKTRLAEKLGARAAAELQRLMTEHAAAIMNALRKQRSISVEIQFAGGDESTMQQWLGPDFIYRKQLGQDLGQRMGNAFSAVFSKGVERIVVIGSDCPSLTKDILAQAFDCLQASDLVLGPTHDGGYYLIGLRQMRTSVFAAIPWGTENVFAATRDIADQEGISCSLLETLHDVDRPKDLDRINLDRLQSLQ